MRLGRTISWKCRPNHLDVGPKVLREEATRNEKHSREEEEGANTEYSNNLKRESKVGLYCLILKMFIGSSYLINNLFF